MCVFPIRHYSSLWMTSPERSFGSNQVVLGGMMLPVSAMSISCFIVTGYNARATRISPLSTRRFSSPSPRMPPTKSMRLSERRSLMPNISSNMNFEEMVTSSTPIGSASSYVPGFAVSEYHLPLR